MTAVFAKHLGAADSTAEAGVAGDSTAEGSALAWLRAQSSVLSLAEATMAAAMGPRLLRQFVCLYGRQPDCRR
jgi:hypothetical protein